MAQKMMKAIQIHQPGGPDVMRIEQVPVRDPGPGEVRVRHRAIGVNFIDIYFRIGLYKPDAWPSGLGQEASGIAEAVGKGVKHLRVGDRVAYAQGPLGAYAETHTLPADNVIAIPDHVSFEQAAAILLKGLTVQYLFRQTYRLQGHETILFHAAAGGVGLVACQWARALGVKLIGTASSDAKAKLALAHGAWKVINTSRENIVERVLQLTGGAKLPVVYDGVGKDTWLTSLDCLQPRGLMVSFGNASGAVTGVDLGILAAKGSLFVTRPNLAAHYRPLERLLASSAELFDILGSGQVKGDAARSFPLEKAGEAHELLAGRKTTGSTILLP